MGAILIVNLWCVDIKVALSIYTGALKGSVLQNNYSVDIVSWVAKSPEQIMYLYKCFINLYIFQISFNPNVAIFIIMHIASKIGGQQ